MKLLIWLALSFVTTAPLWASDSISDYRQQELMNILIQDCGSCHGLTMKGGLGQALLLETLKGKSAEYISRVILYGKADSAMPAWRSLLSPVEARWIADRLLQEEFQ